MVHTFSLHCKGQASADLLFYEQICSLKNYDEMIPERIDVNYRRPASICLTEDLLSRFGLFEQFQRQVLGHGHKQPHYPQQQPQPTHGAPSLTAATGFSAGANGASVGRSHSQPIAQTQAQPGGQNDDPAGAAKKEKKREKELYKSLFKNLPGKHDTKRDRYLSELLMQPPKETRITLLDDSVAEIAFTIFDVPQVNFSFLSRISFLFLYQEPFMWR